MALITNKLAELYNPEDFEPPRNPFAKYRDLHPAMHGYGAPRRPIEFAAKRCETCGREYSPGAAHQKYCSKECRAAARRVGANGKMPKSATCPVCGAEFAPKVHNQRYCSKECNRVEHLEKRREKYRRERGRCTACVLVALALALVPWTASADEPLEVMDLPLRHAIAGGSMSHGMATIVEPTIPAESEEAWQEPEEPVGYDVGYVTETARLDAAYYGDGTDAAYGENGPTREMPGYHDGRKETYYSSNVLPHYRMGEWTVDDDGFYRTTDGYYVVGVGIDEGYEIGDTFEGGRGTCVVMDYGYTENITDYYTAW